MNVRKKSFRIPASDYGAQLEPEHEQSARVPDDGRETIQSSPVPRAQGKTLQHQVQELYRLVNGAIEDLEQVLRALRTIDKDL
ncbi:MAG: hypothetical protein ACLP0J_02485 [Solirubrobacteraceae bacterium]|jgi:hypothetical protein